MFKGSIPDENFLHFSLVPYLLSMRSGLFADSSLWHQVISLNYKKKKKKINKRVG